MPNLEPDLWMLISGWVFASVAIGLAAGFMIGRWYTLSNEPKKLQKERDRTLEALMTVLTSADKLNEDVGEHNEALATAQNDILKIEAGGEVGALQGRLLNSVTHMVESNRKLENELIVTRYQLDEQAQVLDDTRKEARTDALCELGNRKAFDEAMKYAVSQYQTGNESCALMLIDVDHFKRINDTFGHTAGDSVLVSIGQSLMNCVRPDDQVFRVGGDEFGILLHAVSKDNVSAVAKRIRSDIDLCEFHVDLGSESTVVTLSMGLTVAESKDTPETFFVRADEALYHSKEHGRNRLTTKVSNKTKQFTSEPVVADAEKPSYSSYEEFKAMANAAE